MRDREQASQRFRLQTEASRERDVFRHLHAWSHEHRCTALHRNAFPGGGGGDSEMLAEVEPCPDTALVALAQLCCHRLRTRRCFITLISSSTEYVLAEASKTASLQYNSVEDAKDMPWLGTCSFLREEGMASIAIDGWRRARMVRESPAQADSYYTEGLCGHHHVVSDMRREDAYAQHGFIRHSPQPVRFYAAIPLRAATGAVLGSLTMVDEAPRFGLSASELDFLEDVADTISQHLDAVVVRSQRQRSERLIQSLGLFNSGKSSLRQWWSKQEDSRIATAGRHSKVITTQQRRVAEREEFGVHASSSSSTGASARPHDEAASADSDSGFDSDAEHRDSDLVKSTATTVRNEVAGNARKRAKISTKDFGSGSSAHSIPAPKLLLDPTLRASTFRKGASSKLDGAEFDLDTASRHTYGRAANLIRQALSADGVVIVNANAVHTKKRSAIPILKQEVSTSSDKSQPRSLSENETSEESASGSERHCLLEAFSTRDASSLHSPHHAHRFNISESFLALLIRRYPNGKIFNFAPDGTCYSSSNDDNATSGSNSETAKNARVPRDGRRLGQVMVGAKSIAFLPIWDEAQDRWCSGMFVWCTAPLRYFDQTEDITYLASWSHSIIAELGRLQALASDKAKGSFISSISHELRSPLHGILAGLEFLEETELTAFQTEMAHTIRTAGKALLDTVDHILDFAKISSFTRAQTRRRIGVDALRHKNKSEVDSGEIGVTATVDLALLSEEVVETIVNAHRYQKSRMASVEVPSVEINIQWRSNWQVEMQPGSWTRILSNLVGNALKYTKTGMITVQLQSLAPDETGLERLRLTVSDTGIGMSREFISRELYTPFKQADSHVSGTGLGLSIVKRICKDSGARLNITSELDVGTCATVDFNAHLDAAGGAVSRDLNVDRFHLFTPDKSTRNPSTSVATGVMRMARDWLDCETTQGPICEDESGSIVYAIAEEDLLTWASQRVAQLTQSPSHILVLGQSMRSVSFDNPTQDLPFIPIFIHQPIGPQKLLRAIVGDKSSTEMGLTRPKPSMDSLKEYEAAGTRPLSMDRPPAGYFPWDKQPRARFQLSPPAPSTDQSATSSAVFSATHASVLNSPSTQRSNSLDSTAWHEATGKDTKKDTVLLVEDNEVNLKLLMALMRKLGYKFLCAVNGREAVDIYRKSAQSILLVLMDISMPIMDGFTATIKIRDTERKQRLSRCHIVALTGVTSDEAKQQAFSSGIDGFYSKPVGMREVKELMSKLQDGGDLNP